MIDKLEFRIGNDARVGVPFTAGFARDYALLRNSDQNPFRSNRYYSEVADLRPFGHPCILHLGSKPGKIATHKLELIDVGKMSLARITSEVERVFSVDSMRLEITRIDTAADIENVPVAWFRDRMRVRYKQWAREIGEPDAIKTATIRKRGVETLNFGNRPNFFRVYDKTAECKHQYNRMLRRMSPDQEPVSFAEFAGFDEGSIRTRVERQIAAGRVPESINTLWSLSKGGPAYNPFGPIEIVDPGFSDPDPRHYPLNVYLAGMHIRTLILRDGWESTHKFLSLHTKGQLKRFLRTYRDFLPAEDPAIQINSSELFRIYQASFRRQFQLPDPSQIPIQVLSGLRQGLDFSSGKALNVEASTSQ